MGHLRGHHRDYRCYCCCCLRITHHCPNPGVCSVPVYCDAMFAFLGYGQSVPSVSEWGDGVSGRCKLGPLPGQTLSVPRWAVQARGDTEASPGSVSCWYQEWWWGSRLSGKECARLSAVVHRVPIGPLAGVAGLS